ncbi:MULTISPECIES: YceD family protein [Thermoanaerobacterium]|uniref:Metal-binding protein n=2 Tax=Thermoanaerobacterium TaxID=28895 RepID=W9E9C3_9THEO|nr:MULTISPECIES: DUF177 domain-containing protein [Thermoanaerobacterium]AFK86752.1 protein of unknown function DUF177 [Thermoanaerobacterium saccharolyticum JW/SL-YS485]ETO38538.1 hypothetical protein V518_1310 [Thermoanaerobacterium aotearoense SCUT27]
MKIDLSKIKGHRGRSIEVNYVENLSVLEANSNRYVVIKPISVTGSITYDSEGIVLKLLARGAIKVTCDRCLDEFEYEFVIPIDEVVNESDDEFSGEVEDEKLDLTKIVIENVELSLPMKFICSNDCKGLCPTCGKNLNHEKCDCQIKEIDPRLSVLNKLLQKM